MVWERAVLLFWAHRWIDCEWGRRISSGATAGRLQGVYFWHTFDPRPLLLGSSTLSSQPPHKRALCMSARICQTKLYSIAPPLASQSLGMSIALPGAGNRGAVAGREDQKGARSRMETSALLSPSPGSITRCCLLSDSPP